MSSSSWRTTSAEPSARGVSDVPPRTRRATTFLSGYFFSLFAAKPLATLILAVASTIPALGEAGGD
jgi:hypothetical protein